MFTRIHSVALRGMECVPIFIEISISAGWPDYRVVGLGDTAVKEAKERVRATWKNSGLKFPSTKNVIVNLAPAHVHKSGTLYDVPIAAGIFLAEFGTGRGIEFGTGRGTQKQKNTARVQRADIPNIEKTLFVGELALDGSVRSIHGVLCIAHFAKTHGYENIFVPKENAGEACSVRDLRVYSVESFKDIVMFLAGTKTADWQQNKMQSTQPNSKQKNAIVSRPDMSEIQGQEHAKRALEIAAAGGHSILLSGPPGSGKTLLSKAFTTILPKPTQEEALEIASVQSVAGILRTQNLFSVERPFRAPHHSASASALVGGGSVPRPGEITLAHGGVLFLDELPEFSRHTLETLRQPLEDGVVTISRAQSSAQFPAKCILIASKNPCPCGYASDPDKECSCSPRDIGRYNKKISGPLLDRIDLHIEVPRLNFEKITSAVVSESSKKIQERVTVARGVQYARLKNPDITDHTISNPDTTDTLPQTKTGFRTNSSMTSTEVKRLCLPEKSAQELLKNAVDVLNLSVRGYYKTLKVARTIADLAKSDSILKEHVAEALQYRNTDRTT